MRRAAEQHGVVARDHIAAAGISDDALHRRTAAGALVRCRPRVFRAAGAPVTWRSDLLAAVLWAGDGALASHRSAAVLWQLDGWEPGALELTVPGTRAPRGQKGVRVHRARGLDPGDCAEIDGIPVTDVARTIIHLASFLRPAALASGLDSALVQGLTRADLVLDRLDALGRRGRRGAPLLVALLAARMDGQRAPTNRFEARLESLLVRAGLPTLERQCEIALDHRVVRPDLAYPELQIAIEADSYRWHGGRSAWEHDLARRTELAAAGWLVLHFSWRDLVERPQHVIEHVARTVELRTFAPSTPAIRS